MACSDVPIKWYKDAGHGERAYYDSATSSSRRPVITANEQENRWLIHTQTSEEIEKNSKISGLIQNARTGWDADQILSYEKYWDTIKGDFNPSVKKNLFRTDYLLKECSITFTTLIPKNRMPIGLVILGRSV